MNAKEIKKIRAALGLTGDQLAERLGVTGNTVRRWECGARQAKGPAVVMLRRLLDDVSNQQSRRPRKEAVTA